MKTGREGQDIIKHFEGLKLKAYRCPADVWTIGYGTTHGVAPGMIITKEEAEEFLRRDLEVFERGVTKLTGTKLTQGQFDALVSFSYNLGLGAYQRSTLRMKVRRGEHDQVPAEFMKWVRASGRVLRGLVLRRQAEAEFYQNKKASSYELAFK